MPLFMLSRTAKEKEWEPIFVAEPSEYILLTEDNQAQKSRLYLLRCSKSDTYSEVLRTKDEISIPDTERLSPYDYGRILRVKRLVDETPYSISVKTSIGEKITFKLVHLTVIAEDGDRWLLN